MTNRGITLKRWTYSEVQRLHKLYAFGKSREDIAADLGMSVERVRQRLQWEVKSESGIVRIRRRKAKERIRQRTERKSPRGFLDPVTSGPRPTDEALMARTLRYAAQPRDLSGALMGDPPLGFSELDKRL